MKRLTSFIGEFTVKFMFTIFWGVHYPTIPRLVVGLIRTLQSRSILWKQHRTCSWCDEI